MPQFDQLSGERHLGDGRGLSPATLEMPEHAVRLLVGPVAEGDAEAV